MLINLNFNHTGVVAVILDSIALDSRTSTLKKDVSAFFSVSVPECSLA